jgi:hypothetical protein
LIADNGERIGLSVFTIEPGTIFVSKLADIFEFETDLNVGSLVVGTGGFGIVGDLVFGDPTTLSLGAAVPLQSEVFKEAVFSQIAESEELYTGIALFNPGNVLASITIDVYAIDGAKTGSTSFTLPRDHRLSRLIRELIPSIHSQVGGSIRVTSDQPLVGQQFFGDSHGNFLSSVPGVVKQ